MAHRSSSGTLVQVALLVAASHASAQDQDRSRFATGTDAVVVDVVVRDASGKPITGLPASAFTVLESGRPQRLLSFDPPKPDPTTDTPGTRASASGRALDRTATQKDVVALVFEQLGPSARPLAVRAARELVAQSDAPAFTGIFAIDRALHAITPYTGSAPAISKGLDTIAMFAGQPRRRAGAVPGAEFDSSAAGAPTRETKDDVPSQRGLATIDALNALVDGLRFLPGRKVVILFSEGLALDPPEDEPTLARREGPQPMNDSWLTDNRYTKFIGFVERANAARVAFYTFDAAGLRTEGPLVNVAFGRAPYVGLQFMAQETGGAFVENTNDLLPGVRRAWSDQQYVYVLGYAPSKPPDGEYREIRVNVACQRCTVLARRGYRASRTRGPGQVGPWDVAPLLFLERGEPAADIPVRASVRAHQLPGNKRVVRIAAEVSLAAPAPTPSDVAGSGRLTILARVRGTSQRTVAVLSQHFDVAPSNGRARSFHFQRDLELPRGDYAVDVIAYRHDTGQAAVRSDTIRVAAP